MTHPINYQVMPGLKYREVNGISKMKRILEMVCDYYHLTDSLIKSKSRERHICFPRQVAMFIMKKYTPLSLKDIAAHFGGRDHTTAIHAIHTINDLMLTDQAIADEINYLQMEIFECGTKA